MDFTADAIFSRLIELDAVTAINSECQEITATLDEIARDGTKSRETPNDPKHLSVANPKNFIVILQTSRIKDAPQNYVGKPVI